MQYMGFKGVTHTDTSSEAASKELATKQWLLGFTDKEFSKFKENCNYLVFIGTKNILWL